MPMAGLDRVLQCHIYTVLKHLQGWWLHHLPGQPVPLQHQQGGSQELQQSCIVLKKKAIANNTTNSPPTFLVKVIFFLFFKDKLCWGKMPNWMPQTKNSFLFQPNRYWVSGSLLSFLPNLPFPPLECSGDCCSINMEGCSVDVLLWKWLLTTAMCVEMVGGMGDVPWEGREEKFKCRWEPWGGRCLTAPWKL